MCKIEIQRGIHCSHFEWENKKYCSRKCKYQARKGITPWNKGKKLHYTVWNKGSDGEYARKLGIGKWMLGKETPDALRRKRSEYMKKRVADGKHNFYIDGRTPENKRIRHSIEYRDWRIAVFTRDNYTCVECGSTGVTLNADHIKPFAYFPELRLILDNGRTLCVPCHQKTDTYKGKALKYKTIQWQH